MKERRGREHPDPVATTWQLSFERVEVLNAAAADLLRVCSFLAPDVIPEELLREGAAYLGSVLAPVVADEYLLDQAVETLRAYSLLRRSVESCSLSMHRLVQVVLKDAMDKQTHQLWAQRVISAINSTFPQIEFKSWASCEVLLPHALVCEELIKDCHLVSQEAGRLLTQTGWYLKERAQYAQAERLLKQGLEIREKALRPEHPDIAKSLNELGRLYHIRGKDVQAERLLKQGLEVREKALRPEYPDIAKSLNNLALLYQEQRKYDKAGPLYKRALEIREQALGPTHPQTALSLNNLAGLYYAQKKYVEAEPLYARALAISEQEPTHPDTATSLNNLAALYQAQGRYTEAEPLYARALEIWEQCLGAEHPTTKIGRGNYARLLRTVGREEEAGALEAEGD